MGGTGAELRPIRPRIHKLRAGAMTLSLRSAALLAHPRSCARRAVRTMKAVEASRRAQMRIAAGELRATGRRHHPTQSRVASLSSNDSNPRPAGFVGSLPDL